MPLSKSELLTEPIQMQLSPNQKMFSEVFSAFLQSTWNWEYFGKGDEPHRRFISPITDFKEEGYLNAYNATFQSNKCSDSQHVKGSETLVKSACQYFCHIFDQYGKKSA